ncbi:hypothetical protein PVAP13_3KG393502 [Panicum virgatum]|uniref:Uncharacterized protein n=1 Tax=Panicum virgatum TaxID=38727 RepID=A0A8T0V7R7_PANVG|nr:hypothetical protein PVAP13_3KG393502 [Panicum virgatum]
MTKATKLFISSLILFLFTTLCIQGAAEYDNVTGHNPAQTLIQIRRGCVPNYLCCPGKSAKDCYRTNVCIEFRCNGPNQPIGACQQATLACNCNNC